MTSPIVDNATLFAVITASTLNLNDPNLEVATRQLTAWQTVLFGALAAVTSLVTVLGNLVVILSFVIERTLRQPTNFFILSLAVSDLLIGLLSMPFYTVYLLAGQQWMLGALLCDLWLSIDYTVCLASIYTVFCITVDRFCSVKIPAKYRDWRTPNKVIAMVTVTWSIPTTVFFVTIFGWQYFEGGRTVPSNKCYVQYATDFIFNCLLQVGYFWTTLTVMLVLYALIYKVALDMSRRSQAKQRSTSALVSMVGQTMTKIGLGMASTGPHNPPPSKPPGFVAGVSTRASTRSDGPLLPSYRSAVGAAAAAATASSDVNVKDDATNKGSIIPSPSNGILHQQYQHQQQQQQRGLQASSSANSTTDPHLQCISNEAVQQQQQYLTTKFEHGTSVTLAATDRVDKDDSTVTVDDCRPAGCYSNAVKNNDSDCESNRSCLSPAMSSCNQHSPQFYYDTIRSSDLPKTPWTPLSQLSLPFIDGSTCSTLSDDELFVTTAATGAALGDSSIDVTLHSRVLPASSISSNSARQRGDELRKSIRNERCTSVDQPRTAVQVSFDCPQQACDKVHSDVVTKLSSTPTSGESRGDEHHTLLVSSESGSGQSKRRTSPASYVNSNPASQRLQPKRLTVAWTLFRRRIGILGHHQPQQQVVTHCVLLRASDADNCQTGGGTPAIAVTSQPESSSAPFWKKRQQLRRTSNAKRSSSSNGCYGVETSSPGSGAVTSSCFCAKATRHNATASSCSSRQTVVTSLVQSSGCPQEQGKSLHNNLPCHPPPYPLPHSTSNGQLNGSRIKDAKGEASASFSSGGGGAGCCSSSQPAAAMPRSLAIISFSPQPPSSSNAVSPSADPLTASQHQTSNRISPVVGVVASVQKMNVSRVRTVSLPVKLTSPLRFFRGGGARDDHNNDDVDDGDGGSDGSDGEADDVVDVGGGRFHGNANAAKRNGLRSNSGSSVRGTGFGVSKGLLGLFARKDNNTYQQQQQQHQKMKSENRALKALRTITIILGAFVLCWTPWHVMSLYMGYNNFKVSPLTELLYDISYWLCYMNSPINPFCYALANQQFKKTFARIFRLDWHRT